MLTGEIRSQIDGIWNDFWSGGVSNPLSVIEQITYRHRQVGRALPWPSWSDRIFAVDDDVTRPALRRLSLSR